MEVVIGLEVHVQLRSATKLLCGNAAEYGAPPNAHLCPVCLGLPGALPVLNRGAVELAVQAALGLGCTVHGTSTFVRKHYHYPDLPRGYQVTQHERPLATGGVLEVPAAEATDPVAVRIRRLHLEEDTGRSLHDRVPDAVALDLNRAGVPLIEIVTEPDLRHPAQARALLQRLRQALQYLRVSDCDMEKGELRVDANLSVRAADGTPGARTEVKNLNSFRQVERALAYEAGRQMDIVRRGGQVEGETLLWDAAAGETRPLRGKEEARDYRYLPEPDLPPLYLEPEWVERLRAAVPEMPWRRAERIRVQHGLPPEHADALTAARHTADFYEALVLEGATPRAAASWVLGEVLAEANRRGCAVNALALRPSAMAELLALVDADRLSRAAARQAMERLLRGAADPAEALEGLLRRDAEERLEQWVGEVLAGAPDEVRRYRAGEDRLMGYFVGEVTRRAGGRADPRAVRSALERRLAG